MKKVIFILFTFISLSIYSQQIEFEKALGKENVETLNSLIENFETKTLKNEYPNLKTESAYKEFLKDILKNNSVKGRKIFPESTLKLNIYCVPDSIWIQKKDSSLKKKRDIVKTIYKCLNSKNEIVYSNSESFSINKKITTLDLFEKAKEDVQVNMGGTYIKALEEISNQSEIIKSYLENIKMTADPINSYSMSVYLLKNNIDLNDYFIKRLIFINMIYR